MIVYSGPSRLHDPSPIVAIVTGLDRPTSNVKTGHMAQLWILRSDVDPVSAIVNRQDYAICGDCSLRGQSVKTRSCYVAVGRAPQAVYRAYRAGSYPIAEPSDVNHILQRRHLPIRLGAYGEPTALPIWVLRDLVSNGVQWTGYTHQWRDRPAYRPYLMASCDTLASAQQARSAGWRTFRARGVDEPLQAGEIACPAALESNHRSTCAQCKLCNGLHSPADRRASIAIIAHGIGQSHFLEFRR